MNIGKRELTLLCDFYEITMARGYFHSKIKDQIAYFDVFFRRVPDGGGYAIFAGLEQIIEYIKALKFSDEDIAYLRSKGIFDEEFLSYLRDFRFTGDIWSVEEGTVIFPNEPIMVLLRDVDIVPALLEADAEAGKLSGNDAQVLVRYVLDRQLRLGHGGHADERADFDHIGQHRVLRTAQRLYAMDRQQV